MGTFLRVLTVNDVYKLDNYPDLAGFLRAVRATARVQKREDDEDKERARRRFGGSPTGFSFVQALCDPWRERLGLRGAQHGNCSNWTSRALFLAGLEERHLMERVAERPNVFRFYPPEDAPPPAGEPLAPPILPPEVGLAAVAKVAAAAALILPPRRAATAGRVTPAAPAHTTTRCSSVSNDAIVDALNRPHSA